jgi:nickel transport protein
VSDTVYRSATRRFVPDAQDSIWSAKFAKTLMAAGAPWQNIVGHELELVPLSDPGEIKPGLSLGVRVLFRGKPLADAQVERGDGITPMREEDIPCFKTDGEGSRRFRSSKRDRCCSPSTIG